MWDYDPEDPEDWTPELVEAVRRGTASIADLDAAEHLVDDVSAHMVSVSTGGPAIKEVDGDYKKKAKALRAVLKRLSIANPNKFEDLWRWYARWSNGSLASYASRRTFVADLYRPVRAALEALADGTGEIATGADDGPTGWPDVDRRMAVLQRRVREGEDADDFKAVALQCISVLEALGRAVFDVERHLPTGEKEPHKNAAKVRIKYFLDAVAPGERFANLRKISNGAWDQAQAIKHRDSPNRADAGISADSVALLVAIMRRLVDEAEPESYDRQEIDIPF